MRLSGFRRLGWFTMEGFALATKQKASICGVAPLLALFLTVFFAAIPIYAETADRVTQAVDTTKLQVLPNHVPAWANARNLVSAVPANSMLNEMTIVLSRSPEQEQELEALLANQQNPASPDYHHWLTPTEMGERFGLSTQDIDTVSSWLQSQGLHVNWVSPSRTFIGFNGAAADVGRTFQTQVNYYRVNGARRFAVSSPPLIPEALLPIVKAVRGLYTLEEHPLHSAVNSRFSPKLTAGTSHFLAPADFATIYNIPDSLTGSGVAIGIVGRSRTDFADFTNFRNQTGASFPNPKEIIPTAYGGVDPGPALTAPPAPGVSTGDQGEATLDVLRAGTVAPKASILLVVATNASGGIGDDAQYLVETEPVPVKIINVSFGACESSGGPSAVAFWDALWQQAAAEGISVFVSAGDSAASGCDAAFTTPPASPAPNSPNFLCSSSYATCVGGTEFNDTSNPSQYWSSSNGNGFLSALGYIPEGAWNEPLNENSDLQVAGSGGGVSTIIPTPGWQAGTGVPAARSGRYTPDIAFSAAGHDGYFACFAAGGANCVTNNQGSFSFTIFSGTSAAAPDMAGITALLDQDQGGAVGSLNSRLYQMAASVPSAFHDVTVTTSGVASCSVKTPSMCNNSVAGPTSLTGGQAGFLVNTGYDEVTGLGSLNVSVFLKDFVNSSPAPLEFVKVTPCRVVDTRNPVGPFGGPILGAGTTRQFDIPQSACKIPSSAVAYSLNVTVVPQVTLGYLTIWPSGLPQPVVSTLNSVDGRVKANAAITPAGSQRWCQRLCHQRDPGDPGYRRLLCAQGDGFGAGVLSGDSVPLGGYAKRSWAAGRTVHGRGYEPGLPGAVQQLRPSCRCAGLFPECDGSAERVPWIPDLVAQRSDAAISFDLERHDRNLYGQRGDRAGGQQRRRFCVRIQRDRCGAGCGRIFCRAGDGRSVALRHHALPGARYPAKLRGV